MIRKTGLLAMLLLATVLVLSFSSMAFAESAANVQQGIWENKQVNELRQLRLQEYAQANELKQLRLQECGEVCNEACEPKQDRLQKKAQLNEQKELSRQQKLTLSKRISSM